MGEQVRAGERGFVAPWAFDEAVRQGGVGPRHGGGVHAHKGVEGAHGVVGRFARHEALHGVAQVANLLLIDALHLVQRLGRVGVASGSDEVWNKGHGLIVHKLCDSACWSIVSSQQSAVSSQQSWGAGR